MPLKMTIVGLGQIGASIGLALAEHKQAVTRTGHEKDLQAARHAEKQGAVDKLVYNLPDAVRDADLVILALPVDQVEPTLAAMAQDLRPGAVVMDTAPVKAGVAEWFKQHLPEERYYVGLAPALSPQRLLAHSSGGAAAQADLFQNGLFLVVAPPGTPQEAVRLATDLVRLLGATHLFTDAAEADGLLANAHITPLLVAAALINTTQDQPGWLEARKLASSAYAESTAPLGEMDTPTALATAALLTPENVTRLLDEVIAGLQDLRTAVHKQDREVLVHLLEQARAGRQAWWGQRQAAKWGAPDQTGVELPTLGEVFGRFFGLGRKPKGK
jgi:prephenate dehydrogenase